MNANQLNLRTLYRDYNGVPARQQEGASPDSRAHQIAGQQPYTNDPYVVNHGTDMTSRNAAATIAILIFLTFLIFLALMRRTCCTDRSDREGETQEAASDGPPKKKPMRTQAVIEKMLLLKKVKVVHDATSLDVKNGRTRGGNASGSQRQGQTRKLERKKTNLVILSNCADDELDESRACPICLCDYENDDGICYSHNTQCVHRFHTNCGLAWLAKHDECPVCRAQYLVEPSSEDVNQSSHHQQPTTPCLPRYPITIVEEGDIESSFPPGILTEARGSNTVGTSGLSPPTERDAEHGPEGTESSSSGSLTIASGDSDAPPPSTTTTTTTE